MRDGSERRAGEPTVARQGTVLATALSWVLVTAAAAGWVLSLARPWQTADAPYRPAGLAWGVSAVVLLGVATWARLLRLNQAKEDGGTKHRAATLWALLLIVAGVALAALVWRWADSQSWPAHGSTAAALAGLAASAALGTALWRARPAHRRRRAVPQAASAFVAVLAVVAFAGWNGMSLHHSTTRAIAPAPPPLRPTSETWHSAREDNAVIAGDLVVVNVSTAHRSGVAAYDPRTGRRVWEYVRNSTDEDGTSVTASAHAVALALGDGRTIFLDSGTGKVLATTDHAPAWFDESLLANTTYVTVTLFDQVATAISARSGRVLWQRHVGVCGTHEQIGIPPAPLAGQGSIVAIGYECFDRKHGKFPHDHVALITRSGSQRDTTLPGVAPVPPSLTPTSSGFIVSYQVAPNAKSQRTVTEEAGIDRSSGRLRWSRSLGFPSLDGGLLAPVGAGQAAGLLGPPATGGRQTCGRFDETTGQSASHYPATTCQVLRRAYLGPGQVWNGKLFLLTSRRTHGRTTHVVTVISAATGRVLAQTALSRKIPAPVVAVQPADGSLVGVDERGAAFVALR